MFKFTWGACAEMTKCCIVVYYYRLCIDESGAYFLYSTSYGCNLLIHITSYYSICIGMQVWGYIVEALSSRFWLLRSSEDFICQYVSPLHIYMPNVQVADVSNLKAGVRAYKKDKVNCMLDAYVFDKFFKHWSLQLHSSWPSETPQEPEVPHRHHHSSLGPLQPPQALSAPPLSAARFLGTWHGFRHCGSC